MEFKKKVLKFKFEGHDCEVKFPNIKQIEDFQANQKGEDPSLGETLDFLECLGLEKSISYEMEPEHLSEIINHISGQKKS